MNDAPGESDKSEPYAASVTRPPLWRMLFRGVRRRCPWCGQRGAYFTGWFAKDDHCPGCGLRWRRGDVGFELGAATMSAIFTLGTIVVLMAVGLAAMWPDVHTLPLVAGLAVVGVALPTAGYGPSYTLWQAFDLAMRPASPEDFELTERRWSDTVDGDGDGDSDG